VFEFLVEITGRILLNKAKPGRIGPVSGGDRMRVEREYFGPKNP
jgi:hypothetical protein